MKIPLRLPVLALSLLCLAQAARAREFTVISYNVENLFDADKIAIYDDYVETGEPDGYNPAKMFGKIRAIGETLKTFNDGQGPEVVGFNEIEMDFTPGSHVTDYAAFLEKYRDTTAEKMLTTGLNEEIRGLPAEALLLKHLEDIGLKGYHVAIGADQPDFEALASTDKGVHKKGQKNALFSKFPIKDVQSHSAKDARDILEVTIDVEGHPFTVFVNHWKSGASNPAEEETRRSNAKTLRDRVEAILAKDPSADILLVGDFNSQYNQSVSYPVMGETGVNDVLGSRGDEQATASGADTYSLYNLWHELPPQKRGSDHFGGKWGTLMQMMITPGLYDHKAIQYIDGSFAVVILPGINAITPLNIPHRWSNAGEGSGASDHFPVSARFRTTEDSDPAKRMTLSNAGTEAGDAEVRLVYTGLKAGDCPEFTAAIARDFNRHMGEIFRVRGSIASQQPLVISVHGKEFLLWTTDKTVDSLKPLRSLDRGAKVELLGQLGMHRGKVQFLVEDRSWVLHFPEQK